MKQPEKWRETIDPFSLKFNNFTLKEVLGYPHAGNDVFYVLGIDKTGEMIKAFLKVERQKTADIKREVLIINKLKLKVPPTIIDYSFDSPKYILTKEVEGERLSYILGNNKNMESLKYMEAYAKLMAKIHSIKIEAPTVKPRDFKLPHEFYIDNQLEYIENFSSKAEFQETKCFIHADCHYANILWKDYKVSALLDYELSGYGSREYDLAWALTLRQGQKFLQTEEERELFLKAYSKYHDFSRQAFDYYMVMFNIFFYKISPGEENDEYRTILVNTIKNIISKYSELELQ